ncbi:site-specific integrase [Priestia filamentosa]|nr:site-specific integrase [Priestia filamentosa]
MAYFRKIKSKTAKKGYTWGFTMDVGIDPVTGKRKQTSRRGFTTKSEAEVAYHKLKDQIYKGLKLESNDVLFKDVLADWLEMYKKTVKVSTIKSRRNLINHLLHYFGDMKLKNIKSIRTIFIDESIQAILKKHRVQQSQYKLMSGTDYVNEDFVFAKLSGHPLTVKLAGERMKRILKKTSLEKDITPHCLRHTHTSLLIEAGAGIKEIQEILGHGDVQTTMNIYAHMTKDLKEKTSQKFGELMKGLSENL